MARATGSNPFHLSRSPLAAILSFAEFSDLAWGYVAAEAATYKARISGASWRPCSAAGTMIKSRGKREIPRCARNDEYERTRTNQEVYYQPTGAKTQRHARVASAHTSSVTRRQIMVLRW
jgi:hypothetical protein